MAREGRERESEENARIRAGRAPLFPGACAAGLASLVALLVVPMTIGVLPREEGGPPPPDAGLDTLELMGNSALAAVAIALFATAIGTVVAWRARGARPGLVAAMLLPLALPGYLAFAGWGLLRAPGTWTGDWIGSIKGPHAADVARAIDVTLAIVAMGLWAWPLAMVVVLAAVRRIEPDVLVMARQEPLGVMGRAVVAVRLVAPAIGASFVLVGLLALGTAIPLHLANVPTLAIKVWLLLDRVAPDQQWRAYAAAWPLWGLAALAGWWLGGRATSWATGQRARHGSLLEPVEGVRRGWWVVMGVLAISVGVPAGILMCNLRDPGSLVTFWRLSGEGVAWSGTLAAVVAVGAVAIASAVSVGLGSGGWAGRVAGWTVRAMLMLGLAPGVLVGAAMVTGWNRVDPSGRVADSMAIEVLAHTARLGWVGALAGCVMARLEHPALRDLRALDRANALHAWARTGLRLNLPLLGAAGIATAMLSFNEIEASVVVRPPGPGNLSRQILNYLHFARMEEMCAAAVWLVGLGVPFTVGVGWLLDLRSRVERGRGHIS